jgi:hypothetical protein
MRMKHDRDWRPAGRGLMKPALEPAGRAAEDYFGHVFLKERNVLYRRPEPWARALSLLARRRKQAGAEREERF